MITPMSPTAAYFPRPTFPSHRHKSETFIAIAGSPLLEHLQLVPKLASKTHSPDKKLPRNSGSPQPTGILCAKFPSSRESSKSTEAAVATRSRGPAPPLRPPRRTGSHRSAEISFPASVLPAAFPAAHRRANLAEAQAPSRAAPESEQSTARCAYRTGTPRQKTTTPARAAPSRQCTHLPAKSCFFSSLLLCVPLRSQRHCIIFFSS